MSSFSLVKNLNKMI